MARWAWLRPASAGGRTGAELCSLPGLLPTAPEVLGFSWKPCPCSTRESRNRLGKELQNQSSLGVSIAVSIAMSAKPRSGQVFGQPDFPELETDDPGGEEIPQHPLNVVDTGGISLQNPARMGR